MYIQITDHCNMACAHCGFSCGPRKKNFMSMSLYEAAVEFFGDDSIVIGGGEPTLHPDFWKILGFTLGSASTVWMATNGSMAKTSILLANMAKSGIMGVALSRDHYHAEIDPRVVRAFHGTGAGQYYYDRHRDDLREIRDVSHKIMKAGRAARTMTWHEEGCVCEGIMVDPNGNIWSCGCKRLLLGHVLSGWNKVGQRFQDRHEHPEWGDIYDDACLFHQYHDTLYKRFLKWLKED